MVIVLAHSMWGCLLVSEAVRFSKSRGAVVQRSDDIPKRLAQALPVHWTCCQLREDNEGLKNQIYHCYAI